MQLIKIEDVTTEESSSIVRITLDVAFSDLPSDTGRKITDAQFRLELQTLIGKAMRAME